MERYAHELCWELRTEHHLQSDPVAKEADKATEGRQHPRLLEDDPAHHLHQTNGEAEIETGSTEELQLLLADALKDLIQQRFVFSLVNMNHQGKRLVYQNVHKSYLRNR